MFLAEKIQSTIGVDQDLWCYAKGMDSNNGCSTVGITFYAWDFVGQVSNKCCIDYVCNILYNYVGTILHCSPVFCH